MSHFAPIWRKFNQGRRGAGRRRRTENIMIIRTQEDVTKAVLDEIARAPDPRFREVMSAFVRHLHAFAREVRLTEEEFQRAKAKALA